jgi:F0F1-type ATP synthase membrane subunit a
MPSIQTGICIKKSVKYVRFCPYSLTLLFFVFCGNSFRIVDGISFMAKDEDDTSIQTFVQKLTEV